MVHGDNKVILDKGINQVRLADHKQEKTKGNTGPEPCITDTEVQTHDPGNQPTANLYDVERIKDQKHLVENTGTHNVLPPGNIKQSPPMLWRLRLILSFYLYVTDRPLTVWHPVPTQ